MAPAYLDRRAYEGGSQLRGTVLAHYGGPDPKTLYQRLKVDKVQFRGAFLGNTLQRLFLKVAYGVAVSRLGLDGIEKVYVTDAILGRSNDCGRWMGNDDQVLTEPKAFHVADAAISGNRDIIVRVRLFPPPAPEYVVVVGRAAPAVIAG
jgi:hypothetical protein